MRNRRRALAKAAAAGTRVSPMAIGQIRAGQIRLAREGASPTGLAASIKRGEVGTCPERPHTFGEGWRLGTKRPVDPWTRTGRRREVGLRRLHALPFHSSIMARHS